MGTLLGPKYIPHTYMDPLGLGDNIWFLLGYRDWALICQKQKIVHIICPARTQTYCSGWLGLRAFIVISDVKSNGFWGCRGTLNPTP